MKKLGKLVLVALVVMIALVIGVFFFINQIIEQGVERGATYALGVETNVGSADLAIFGGQARLSKLAIDNPEGFEADTFFYMGDADVAVTLGSLTKDTVHVPYIHLTDLKMSLEKKDGKANYQVILDNLGRFESKDAGAGGGTAEGSEPAAEGEGGKRFVVDEILIKNIDVDVAMIGIGSSPIRQQVKIPEIRLTEIGSDSEKGVVLSQLSGIITKAVLKAVVQSGIQLPGAIVKELGSGLANLGGVGVDVVGNVSSKALDVAGGAGKVATEAVGEAGKAAGEVGKAAGDAGKAVGDAVGDIGKGIGGIFGGKKDESSQSDQ